LQNIHDISLETCCKPQSEVIRHQSNYSTITLFELLQQQLGAEWAASADHYAKILN